MIVSEDLKSYFEKARTWEQDRLLAAHRSRRIAWIVASVASTVAIAAVGAVAALTPLKTVQPFVIRVDNSTGIVDVVNALDNARETYDEAVTKYFAARYVRAREGFQAAEAREAFQEVSLLSGAPEQVRFASYYSGKNPESPQIVYGRNAVARINIKSISAINKNVVAVRYLREIRRGEETKTSHWIATLTYQYSKAATSTGDRLFNPLGFTVTEYRSDPEAVSP
jgi:type IV secretion system protein VirB8